MKYIEFQHKFWRQILFSKREILLNFPNFDNKNLNYWQDKNYIKKIKNWVYTFSNIELNLQKLFFISNNIYFPSYIWTYQALSYYQIIPEQVFQITAISTKKTNEFKSLWNTFFYQKISPKLFWWYKIKKVWWIEFYIWDIEKTILDFFYLNKRYKDEDDILWLRFDFDILQEKLDERKLLKYLKIFNNRTLEKTIFIFLNILKNA
jgi:predicted transcriptional regulator of viral defense system